METDSSITRSSSPPCVRKERDPNQFPTRKKSRTKSKAKWPSAPARSDTGIKVKLLPFYGKREAKKSGIQITIDIGGDADVFT